MSSAGDPGVGNRVEVVRGVLDEETRGEIMSFWEGLGLVGDEAAAHARLPEVVSVLRTPAGEVAGTNSVYSDQIQMIGDRRFWVYRSALGPGSEPEDFLTMLGACFEALADEFADSGTGPVGVCAPIEDEALLERHPEAVWPEVGFLYAGYFPNGRQIRIRYFEEARI